MLCLLGTLSFAAGAHWSKAKSWDKLDAGEDPECSVKKDGIDCTLRKVSAVVAMTCAENANDPRLYESRCFVPTNDKDGDHRLSTPPREKDRPYLFAWRHARILAGLDLLTVAYYRAEYHASPALAVVPQTLWNLDSYPDPSRSDPSHVDGFKGKGDLRLVLRPSALRLMWSGILDMLVEGWPTDALAVMQAGGYKLSNRDQVLTKLEALCPVTGAAAPADTYCPSLRKTLLDWGPLAMPGSTHPATSAQPTCSTTDPDEWSQFRAAEKEYFDHVCAEDKRTLGHQMAIWPEAYVKLQTIHPIYSEFQADTCKYVDPRPQLRERLRREPTTREICFAYLEMAKKMLRPGEATDRDGGPHYAFDTGFDYQHCVHTHVYTKHMDWCSGITAILGRRAKRVFTGRLKAA